MQTGRITQLLLGAEMGDSAAREQLWAAVYGELRGLAHGRMAGERRGRTIQTTVLVHEAYLRLLGTMRPVSLVPCRLAGRMAG